MAVMRGTRDWFNVALILPVGQPNVMPPVFYARLHWDYFHHIRSWPEADAALASITSEEQDGGLLRQQAAILCCHWAAALKERLWGPSPHR